MVVWRIVIPSVAEGTLGQAKRQSRALHALGLVEMTSIGSVMSSGVERSLHALRLVDMTLLDHIILADKQYYSFKDNKKL